MSQTFVSKKQFEWLHPVLGLQAQVKVLYLSECERYAKIIVMGFNHQGSHSDYFQTRMEEAIGQEWNVGVWELHHLL